MRYGLNIPAAGEGGDPSSLAELARLAEEAGWDGFFLEDYITYFSGLNTPTYDPWVSLAAIALATKRIRIGTLVTPLPRRRPWKLAREVLTLDHLSAGRVTLGIGLGGVDDQDNFGRFAEVMDKRERAEMLDEGLDILVGLWSGEQFSYRGKHYSVNEATFLPRPVQTPRIPIWIGGSSQRKGVVRRAVRWDGFAPIPIEPGDGSWRYVTPDEVRELHAIIARQRPSAAPFDIVVGGVERGEDWDWERVLRRSLAEAGITWWVEWVHPGLGGFEGMRDAIVRGPLRVD